MNSLTELNNYGLTTIEYTDQRPAKVIFNTDSYTNKTTTITSATVPVSLTFDIEEIINYNLANVRYRISIISNDPAFVASSSIYWSSIPGYITQSGASGVYTLTGLRTVTDWNLLKNPNWLLPAGYLSYTKFFLRLAVIYYDQALAQDITREIDFYDPLYYPVSQFQSSFSTVIRPTYNLLNRSNMTVTSLLFSDVSLIPAIKLQASSSMIINSSYFVGTSCNATATATLTLSTITVKSAALVTIVKTNNIRARYTYNFTNGDYSNETSLGQSFGTNVIQDWSKNTDVLAVGQRTTVYESGAGTGLNFLGLYKKNPANLNLDFTALIETFDYDTLPHDQYLYTDFKFRADGTKLVIGGNPRGGPEIYTVSSNGSATKDIRPYTPAIFLSYHPTRNVLALSGTPSSQRFTGLSLQYFKSSTNTWETFLSLSTNTNYYNPTGSAITLSTPVRDIDWCPAGDTLAVCTGSNVRIYNATFGTRSGYEAIQLDYITLLNGGERIRWSPSGNYIAITSNNANFYVYKRTNATTYTLLVNSNLGISFRADWNGDESVLSVATNNGIINFYRSGDTFTQDSTNITVATCDIAWRKV